MAILTLPALAHAQDPAPETGGERALDAVEAERAPEGSIKIGEDLVEGELDPPATPDEGASADEAGASEATSPRGSGSTADAGSDSGLPAPKARAPRVRRAQGMAFRLEGGQAMWSLDAGQIERQVGNLGEEVRPLLVDRTPNAPGGILHIGFNILGHATIAGEMTATGWEVLNASRGGGGFISGNLAWHPIELLAELIPMDFLRQRAWDISLFGGGGWGAVGKDRALRGMHILTGARAEIYFSKWFAMGLSVRHYSLRFDEYVVHWDNDVTVSLAEGSGGSVLVPSLTVTLRVPTRN